MNELTFYTDFQTSVGPCALAWDDTGVCALSLGRTVPHLRGARQGKPEPTRIPVRATPPPAIEAVIDSIRKHLNGEPQDLGRVPLSQAALEQLGAFHRRVYEHARQVPPGQTTSYQELAARCGSPRAARAVGQAMAKNPFLLLVPCHRVLAANKKPGGFSAPGGWKTKKRLLAIEGLSLDQA